MGPNCLTLKEFLLKNVNFEKESANGKKACKELRCVGWQDDNPER